MFLSVLVGAAGITTLSTILEDLNKTQKDNPISSNELKDALQQLHEDEYISLQGDPRNPRIRRVL